MKNNKEEVRGRKIVHVRQFYQLYLAGADLTYKLNELEATGKRIRSIYVGLIQLLFPLLVHK